MLIALPAFARAVDADMISSTRQSPSGPTSIFCFGQWRGRKRRRRREEETSKVKKEEREEEGGEETSRVEGR